jgi:hypothetical protein
MHPPGPNARGLTGRCLYRGVFHVPSSSMSEVAEDLSSAIFKVSRHKTAGALAEEFVSLYEKSYPKVVSLSSRQGYGTP